jgi:hypothetical protein
MQINLNASPAFIANNEIILNGSTCYGFYGSTSGSSGAVFSKVNYLNNSIYVKGDKVYGIYLYEYSGSTQGTTCISTFKYNNIYASSISGNASYAYYLASTIAIPYYNFDYNNYYSTDTNLVYITTPCKSIADIIATGTGKDSNSINIDPMFASNPVNLSPSAVLQCPLVSYIPYDINNELRTLANNSMGCYAKFFPTDAGLDTFFMPTPISFIGNQTSVVVRLKNYGTDILQNATIQWTLDTILQISFNATNLNLNQYEDTVLTIGSFIPSKAGNIDVVAWSECVGDGNKLNDSIRISTYACDSMLNGTYTIGSNLRDFETITDALTSLSNCGVSGPVIFLIDSGTYEAMNIPKTYSGTNDTNIVTFTSATGNASDVKIVAPSSVAITLTNTGYLNFNHLTIEATNMSIPTAVKIVSSATNIEFSNCIIKAPVVQSDTTKDYMGVILSDNITTNINDCRILYNIIDGGVMNICLQASKNQTTYGENIVINSNVMTNAYFIGMQISYADISIAYNTITSQANSTANFIGMLLERSNVYLNANKIHGLSSNHQNFTGINLSYINHDASQYGLLSNNEIIGAAISADNFGISINQFSYVRIINNSIFSNSSSAKCLYVNNATSDIVLKNNNFISSATAYPIYFTSANYAQGFEMDYNNYYSGGSYVGYAGSGVPDISTWKSLTMKDAHSVSIFPSFVDINTDLRLTNSNNNGLVCPIDSNVTTDINDSLRVLYTYMGAYTATVFAGSDLEILSIVEPINTQEVICYQNYSSVKVAIANQGGYLIDFTNNNLKLCINVIGAINFQADTVITSGSIDILQTDTFEITNILPVSQNGTYHITAWLENVIDQVKDNDTVSADYTVNLLTLPYGENFSTSPSEFTFKQLSGTSGWSVEQGAGSNPIISPTYGTGRLTFASELGAIGTARLHPINLLGSLNPKLEFWYAHDDNNSSKADKLFVRISIDGGATFQNLTEIRRYNNTYTTPAFEYYSFDLSSYSIYSCVIIDFYAQSSGGGCQNIDSIAITSEEDLMIDLDIPDESELIACELDSIPIVVKLINTTSQLIDLDEYPTNITIKISDAVDTTTFQLPLSSGTIAGNASVLYTLANAFDFSTNGTYKILAYIDAVDENQSNDTIRMTRTIHVDADLYAMDTTDSRTIGDTIYPTIYIANKGNLSINGFTATININNALIVTEYIDTLLVVGDSLCYTFKQPYLIPVVTEAQPFYQLKINVSLSCDGNMSNNSISKYYEVDIPLHIDLAITKINYPIADSCETGFDKVYPSIEITNNGTGNSQGGTLTVEIDSAGIVIDTFTESISDIASENTITHTCTQSYTVPNFNGNYIVKFTIEHDDDIDLSNNELSVVTCAKENVGVLEIEEQLWTLGQNIPNPAQTMTEIPYAIPVDGMVNVKIMSVSGQVLYQKETQATAGNHSLVLDIDFLSNGIYYYSMEYAGRTIVKKMTVNK